MEMAKIEHNLSFFKCYVHEQNNESKIHNNNSRIPAL